MHVILERTRDAFQTLTLALRFRFHCSTSAAKRHKRMQVRSPQIPHTTVQVSLATLKNSASSPKEALSKMQLNNESTDASTELPHSILARAGTPCLASQTCLFERTLGAAPARFGADTWAPAVDPENVRLGDSQKRGKTWACGHKLGMWENIKNMRRSQNGLPSFAWNQELEPSNSWWFNFDPFPKWATLDAETGKTSPARVTGRVETPSGSKAGGTHQVELRASLTIGAGGGGGGGREPK